MAKDRARSQRNRTHFRQGRHTTEVSKKLTNTSRSVHKKRNEVVKGLAQKFEMRITLPGKRGRKNRTMTDDQENFLLNLFERSGMTYTNPGSKGNVYLGKTNGKKNINTEKLLPLEAQRRLKYH